jgi:serine phosphatase RsbU (regulator of sigma subunit)
MVEDTPGARTRPWVSGADLLLLFTDGVSDARDRFGIRFGEQPIVETVRRYRAEPPAQILTRILDELSEHTGAAVQRDDLAVVLVRS